MQTKTFFRITPVIRLACGLLFALGFVAFGPLAHSAEEAASEAPAEVAEEKTEAAADATELQAPADSVGGQMGEVSLDKFIPSEEISADGAVSFPVDI